MTAAPTDKSKPYIPLAGGASDGWSNEEEATATCFCGAVQLKFPTQSPGFVASFTCHCSDCRKLTGSMFASNFLVADTHLTHLRGGDNLTTYSQSHTIAAGNTMTNYFCSTCGTLMYRITSGYPGISVLRIGIVDDFNLHETQLKPQVEQFVESRVGWLHGLDGIKQVEGMAWNQSISASLFTVVIAIGAQLRNRIA
ncbi:Mss4-like protein [Mycena leptocephala]|nr:Mss4-like protein [Mycena leptocephala]